MQPFRLPPPNLNQIPPSQPMFDKYGHPINPVIVQHPPPYPGQKTYYAQPNIQYYPPAQPNNNAHIYNANNQIINNEQILQNAHAVRKPGPAYVEANAPVANPYHVPNNVFPNAKEVINNPPKIADQNNENAKNIQNDGGISENSLKLKNQQSSGSITSRTEAYIQNNQSPVSAEKHSPSTNQYPPSSNFIINNQPPVTQPMYVYYPGQNPYYQKNQPQVICQPQPHIIGQPQPQNYVNPQAKPQNLAQIFGQPQIFSRNQPYPLVNPQNLGEYQHPNLFIDNSFGGQGMKKNAVEKPNITVTGPEENIVRSGLRRTKSISDLEKEKEEKLIVDEVIPDIKLMETAHFIKNSNLSEIEKKNYEEKFLALEKQLQIVRQQVVYWKQKFESTLKNEGEGLNRSGLSKSSAGGADEILKLKEFLVGKNNECEEWKVN